MKLAARQMCKFHKKKLLRVSEHTFCFSILVQLEENLWLHLTGSIWLLSFDQLLESG